MDYSQDYYKGIAGVYFKRVLKTIIRMGQLDKEKGLILDFGCGVGHLKKKLKEKNVIGYDIIDKLSDIKDYNNLKPTVVVCNGVLEHLDKKELQEVIENFKKMNSNAKLVTAIPTENWVSSIGKFITGLHEAHDDHKIDLNCINKFLSKECYLLKTKNIFTMMEVRLWRFKSHEK